MPTTVNHEQRLYVIPSGRGYSCLGFDYAEKKTRAVAEWADVDVTTHPLGTLKHYAEYERIMSLGAAHSIVTSKRCPAELTPELIGLEGKRVEIISPDGERSRFIVGKSTGWLPCHLEIKRRNSTGGGAAYLPKGATVRVVTA